MGITDVDVASERDINSILAVASALPAWFTPSGLGHLAVDLRFQRALIARRDGHVVGFLSWFVNYGVAWIAWMGVLPQRHRQGAGRALVERLVADLTAEGLGEVRVETLGDGVEYAPYAATRAFYRAVGFHDFERVTQDNPEWPEKLTLCRVLRHDSAA